MGWFSKKEEVPELPPAPSMSEFPKSNESDEDNSAPNQTNTFEQFPSNTNEQTVEKRNLPELPTFPNSNNGNKINQEMVKSAVTDTPEEKEETSGLPELPTTQVQVPGQTSVPGKPEGIQKSEFPRPHAIPKKTTVELDSPPKQAIPQPPQNKQTKPDEPIFVRLDKYQDAKKSFNEVRNKVLEVENILTKLNENKEREETEIRMWTEKVSNIKSRLAEVDSKIFEKV